MDNRNKLNALLSIVFFILSSGKWNFAILLFTLCYKGDGLCFANLKDCKRLIGSSRISGDGFVAIK